MNVLNEMFMQEREPDANTAEPSTRQPADAKQAASHTQPSDAVEGYVPRHPKQNATDATKKSRFAASAKQEASPAHPSSVTTGAPGSALYAFLKGQPMPSTDAFEILPVPADPSNPDGPSIDDLLDQGQALRPWQPPQTDNPPNPNGPSMDDLLDQGQALRPWQPTQPTQTGSAAQGTSQVSRRKPTPTKSRTSHSTPSQTHINPSSSDSSAATSSFQNGNGMSNANTAPRHGIASGPHSFRPTYADYDDDGAFDEFGVGDQWDDYGVVNDDQLEATFQGPMLHANAALISPADDRTAQTGDHMGPMDHQAAAAAALPSRVQPNGKDSLSRQGPVIERPSMGSAKHANLLHRLAPGASDTAGSHLPADQGINRPHGSKHGAASRPGLSLDSSSKDNSRPAKAPAASDGDPDRDLSNFDKRPPTNGTRLQSSSAAQVGETQEAAREGSRVYAGHASQAEAPQIILDIDGDAADGLADAVGRLKVGMITNFYIHWPL